MFGCCIEGWILSSTSKITLDVNIYDVSIDDAILRNVCPQAVEFYRSSDERRDQATSLRR